MTSAVPFFNVGSGMAGLQFVASQSPAAWFRYGVGITVTGSGVSTWADQSGNGRDLLQGTDANRPALQADNSILFDGLAHYLKCGAFTLNQPETVYFLGKQVTWTAGDTLFDGDGALSGALLENNASPQLNIAAPTLTAANTGLAVDTYGVVAVVFNGASSLLQINNGTATTGNAGATNMGGFTLGTRGTAAGNFGNLQVKEAILFASAHDADTRTRVIRYLAAVGGIAV